MRIRTFPCRQCGKSLQLRGTQTAVKCPQCGTENTLAEAQDRLAKQGQHFPNPTPIRLGQTAMWHGKEYRVIARLVYSMTEEGQRYFWHEFQLSAADGEILYLEFDDDRWKLMRPVTPSSPLPPFSETKVGMSIAIDGERARVNAFTPGRLEFVQGEPTFAAHVGETRFFVDASNFKNLYALEYSNEEVEAYKGRFAAFREVLIAFDMRDRLKALDSLEERHTDFKRFATACLLFSLIAFTYWLVSLGSGRMVAKDEVSLNEIGTDGVRLGPFDLQASNHVHRLEVYGSMTQASAWVAAVLENAQGTELIGSQGDFWDESGRDSDGAWHESYLNADTTFVVKRDGTYYVRLYAEKDTLSGSFNTAGYRVYAGVIYPYWMLGFGVVTMGLSILFYALGSPETVNSILENMSDDD